MQLVSPAQQEVAREERGRSLKKSPSGESLSKIVQSFNTWAFKREQPSDLGLLTRFVGRAVMLRQPVSFVLYWGKGPRNDLEHYDTQCMDYLVALAGKIKAVYPMGASMSLVLTDTHARHNGHSAQVIARYFTAIEAEADKRGFDCYLLGELTEAAGRGLRVDSTEPSEEVLQTLSRSAERWYRGGGSTLEGARAYYAMNMLEKRVIEHFFPSSIFATFNGRECRALFPDALPIFYMYSLKRGTSVKPWFLPETQTLTPAVNG
jgi:hypothetical protein